MPHGLSFLATGTWNGKVQGINDLQQAYEQRFGPGSYKPNIPVTYWTFRLMILFGALAALIAVLALWYIRRQDRAPSKWLVRAAMVLPLLPLAANSFGWIFTEMGRQPWIVFGLMQTRDGVSPTRRRRLGPDLDDHLHSPVRRTGGDRGAPAAPVRPDRAGRARARVAAEPDAAFLY